MKYSQVLISALFGSMVAAAPFKRDLVIKTEIAYETVVVYTTVWDSTVPVAEATTTAGGYFYEQPTEATTTPAVTSTPAATSTPAYTPTPEPSSVYTPAVVETPAPSSTVVVVTSAAPAPKPVETSSTPAPAAPTTTEAAYTPAPVSSAAPAATTPAAAPAAQKESTASSSTGESFTGVDLTINPLTGALGACGEPMHATDFYVAIAAPAWGASTYDVQTGKATNKWCGQKIKIEYGGKSVDATVMDMCPGCSGHDLDLSDAAWAAIGMTEWTRVQGSWSMVN
ncbi:uncharacterized protein M421DRAFT_5066 [Didymella exigua CBS 183.55]|uniref:RlpA-like protein double-psi beta-barrel domain-containing protein n=1 Tax=Didymella exigua CBS 183.55 TaxID=1150837 RepID=A0A6A5RSY0_9PLEO|nr:uncharacterized protein M421DRAFT_5066 [Didymella exigua CBS 183.55]KAF1928597.1 hypothetical protein M421DRAFT_5066 [Didymella exigua CBS 183.55]